MIPYIGKDPSEDAPRKGVPRGPQGNGPALQNLTPDLLQRAYKIQRDNPTWSRRRVAVCLSKQIGRWPPFTGETIGKHLKPLEDVANAKS